MIYGELSFCLAPNGYKVVGRIIVSDTAEVVLGCCDDSWATWIFNRTIRVYLSGSYFAEAHRELLGDPEVLARRSFAIRAGLSK